jgi:hypothetical protein
MPKEALLIIDMLNDFVCVALRIMKNVTGVNII